MLYLKKDLAYTLEVGISNIIDEYDNYKIEISLTEKGLCNKKTIIYIYNTNLFYLLINFILIIIKFIYSKL